MSFEGGIQFDESVPEGTPQKLLDLSRINTLGWQAEERLGTGLRKAYANFVDMKTSSYR